MKRLFLIALLGLFCFFSCIKNRSTKNVESENIIAENANSKVLISSDSGNNKNASIDVSLPNVQTVEVLDNWLGIDVKEQLVLDKLGEPDSLGIEEYWDALGTYVQKWKYIKKGILLYMESNEKNSLKHVLLIAITLPCKMSTEQSVGIGSSRNVVEKAYNPVIDRDNTNDSIIVVGSIYEGTIFYFDKDAVSKIFIGAAAE